MVIVENIKGLCNKLGLGIRPLLREFGIGTNHFYEIGKGHKPTDTTMKKANLLEKYLKDVERLMHEINVPLPSSGSL